MTDKATSDGSEAEVPEASTTQNQLAHSPEELDESKQERNNSSNPRSGSMLTFKAWADKLHAELIESGSTVTDLPPSPPGQFRVDFVPRRQKGCSTGETNGEGPSDEER